MMSAMSSGLAGTITGGGTNVQSGLKAVTPKHFAPCNGNGSSNRCEVLDLIPEINRQSRSVRRRHHHDSFGVEELYRSAVEESCRLAVEVRAGGGGKDLSNPRCHTRETKIPRLRS